MAITLRVPSSLKKMLGGNEETCCSGKTVEECIDNLDKNFSGVKERLTEKGLTNSAVMVFLNGKNISNLNGLGATVQDGDEISVIPFVAGG